MNVRALRIVDVSGPVSLSGAFSGGREFDIVKRVWQPRELERQVAYFGWRLCVRTTSNGYFVSASGRRGDRFVTR